MDTIVQFAGWGGVAILLGAYALLAKGIVSQRTWPYHMANFIGSMMLAFNAGMLGHKPFLVFNLAWISVAIMGIARANREGRKCRDGP